MTVAATPALRRRPSKRGRRRNGVVHACAHAAPDRVPRTSMRRHGPRPRVGGRRYCLHRPDVRARRDHWLRRRGRDVRHRGRRGGRRETPRRCCSGCCRLRNGRDGLAERGCRSGHRRRRVGLRDDGRRRDSRLTRRLWPRRGRLEHRPRRQHGQRVDIPLLVRRPAQAEVHVGIGQVDHAARADGADDSTLCDVRTARDAGRAEMDERRRVAERRLDRDGLPTRRHRPREADHPVGRRKDPRPCRRAEVDAAMLARGVRMRTVERERAQDRAVDGPRPRRGRRGQDERAES